MTHGPKAGVSARVRSLKCIISLILSILKLLEVVRVGIPDFMGSPTHVCWTDVATSDYCLFEMNLRPFAGACVCSSGLYVTTFTATMHMHATALYTSNTDMFWGQNVGCRTGCGSITGLQMVTCHIQHPHAEFVSTYPTSATC